MSIEIGRRGFLTGMAALFATPAIVRASSLMPVRSTVIVARGSLLTINMITREAIRLFKTSNQFPFDTGSQYPHLFAETARLPIFTRKWIVH